MPTRKNGDRCSGSGELSIERISSRLRHEAREYAYFNGCEGIGNIYTGDVYDESMVDAALFELGASFDGGAFGDVLNFFGPRRDPKPPRDDDSALPGLGAAGSACCSYDDVHIYVLASQAWMHANCTDSTVVRGLWLRVLEEYRRGATPSEELIALARTREHEAAMWQFSTKKRR